mmetsp:Transcript_1887/g.6034  ORF Transcript_1887/g.6034 Transcript_1887/m.6034 type:complete len:88 (-) Transcript_1887:198-461(-)
MGRRETDRSRPHGRGRPPAKRAPPLHPSRPTCFRSDTTSKDDRLPRALRGGGALLRRGLASPQGQQSSCFQCMNLQLARKHLPTEKS